MFRAIFPAALRYRPPVTLCRRRKMVTGTGRARRVENIARNIPPLGNSRRPGDRRPGVSLEALQSAAERTNQFYAPDPTERTASIGGTIATNASGSRKFSLRQHAPPHCPFASCSDDGRVLNVQRGDKLDFDVPHIPLPNTTKNTAGYQTVSRHGLDRFVCRQ